MKKKRKKKIKPEMNPKGVASFVYNDFKIKQKRINKPHTAQLLRSLHQRIKMEPTLQAFNSLRSFNPKNSLISLFSLGYQTFGINFPFLITCN